MSIEDYIQAQIEQVDVTEVVREEVRRKISDEVVRQIAKVVRDEIDKIVKTEIDIVLAHPVKTDDGWGKRETYPSFEALFKKEFRDKLDKDWEMKRTIEQSVRTKVAELYEKNFSDVKAKIVEQLTK